MEIINGDVRFSTQLPVKFKDQVVWPNADPTAEMKELVSYCFEGYTFDYAAECERLRVHVSDHNRKASRLWPEYAARTGIRVDGELFVVPHNRGDNGHCTEDFSGRVVSEQILRNQDESVSRYSCQGDTREINDNCFLGMLIVANDSYARSVGAFFDLACDELKIPLQDRAELLPMVTVALHKIMEAVFYGKQLFDVARPMQYILSELGDASIDEAYPAPELSDAYRDVNKAGLYREIVNNCHLIPHPFHASFTAGHAAFGYAVLVLIKQLTGRDISDDLMQMAYEFGTFRSNVGVHWLADSEGSVRLVDYIMDLVMLEFRREAA